MDNYIRKLSALLANVTTIEIALEYYNGIGETVYFDNFCIGNFGVISSIYQLSTNESIYVFPNPGKGIFTIELESANASDKFDWRINDLTGRLIYEESGSGKSKHKIDLNEFAKGIYIISVSTSKRRWKGKIILD
ncbi:MAG: T9SS type A sorting domain-containing protein [Bacteroidetes bacterium]|nr:T9SS type A sorting domain-containing protein [Bacteroidota bacterium]